MAVDPLGASLWLATEDCERQMLDLRHLADRVIAHLESFRANIVDAGAAYVTISRARSHAAIYTDSRSALTEPLGVRDDAQVGALDETMMREGTGVGLAWRVPTMSSACRKARASG